MIRRLVAASSAALLLASLGVSAVAAGGPPKVGFYVDDQLYRTVGTPSDFSGTGAPASAYDHIYALGDGLMNVADAKPGDRDFNGGRWMVYAVTWADGVTPEQFTNDGQVLQAAKDGKLTIDWTPVKMFECPVIPLGGRS